MNLPKGTVLGRKQGKEGPDVRSGDLVKRLQEELAAIGYDLGDEAPGKAKHGSYGDKTEQAVAAFQKEKNLGVDGRVGPGTAPAINLAALEAAMAAVSLALKEATKRVNETQLDLAEQYRRVAEELIEASKKTKGTEERVGLLDKAKDALDKAADILKRKQEEFASALRKPENAPASAPGVPEKALVDMTREEAIAAIAAAAKGTQNCVPISVTIAQAIVESGLGKSPLARNTNNLFGITGNGPAGSHESFRKYNTWQESVEDHGKVLCGERYKKAREHLNDPDRYAEEKQKAGYAKDPDYAEKLKKAMKDYDLKKYDK